MCQLTLYILLHSAKKCWALCHFLFFFILEKFIEIQRKTSNQMTK